MALSSHQAGQPADDRFVILTHPASYYPDLRLSAGRKQQPQTTGGILKVIVNRQDYLMVNEYIPQN
jgi:hypothetical protein